NTAEAVQRDGVGEFVGAAPQVGGEDQGRTGGVHLGYEGVVQAARGRLRGGSRREVVGAGFAGEVGVAAGVHDDAAAAVGAVAAQVGGIDEGRGGRAEFRDEGVRKSPSPEGRLQGGSGREVGRIGLAGEVGTAGAVHRDGEAPVVTAAAQVGRVA